MRGPVRGGGRGEVDATVSRQGMTANKLVQRWHKRRSSNGGHWGSVSGQLPGRARTGSKQDLLDNLSAQTPGSFRGKLLLGVAEVRPRAVVI